MDRLLELLAVVVSALAAALEKYRATRHQERAGTVRGDAAGSWVQRFGGKDRRAAPGDTGSHSD